MRPEKEDTKNGTRLMKQIVICPRCGKVHVAIPLKSKRDKYMLISTGLYLSDLSIFMAKDGELTYPVLMNLMVCHEKNQQPVIATGCCVNI